MKQLNIKCATLLLLLTITTAIGMKTTRPVEEYLGNFKTRVPPDLQIQIQRSILENAITFLSQQPFTIPRLNIHSITEITKNDVIVRECPNMISTYNIINGRRKQFTIERGCSVPYTDKSIISGTKMADHSTRKSIAVWDISTNEPLHMFFEPALIVTMTLDENRIVTAISSEDIYLMSTVNVRDLESGTITHTFKTNYKHGILKIHNNRIAIVSSDNIHAWNLETDESKNFQTGVSVPLGAALYNDKAVIASKKNIQIWNIHTGTLLRTINDSICCGDYGRINIHIAMNNDWVIVTTPDNAKAWLLSSPQGTPDENPLVWIKEDADILQGNLIRRACQTTIDDNTFLIAMPKKLGEIEDNETREQMDGRIYFTLPKHVRAYLRNCLKIQAKEIMPLSDTI